MSTPQDDDVSAGAHATILRSLQASIEPIRKTPQRRPPKRKESQETHVENPEKRRELGLGNLENANHSTSIPRSVAQQRRQVIEKVNDGRKLRTMVSKAGFGGSSCEGRYGEALLAHGYIMC
ncbi:hypothetical protein DL766_005559 [Monosporascus sp. MC13-8B]|uniref:Uncharacterized protein n=1 Tax=Monosporascus cannonballus TaxID=155416 RepID=A0ABY0H8Q9_9PEZI|nr:hypothetical protein DL762_004514 [Monosporascus cannonballus]RYO94720.1 hypothetical protein DL763_003994 [Monosporascus cannonballus]RYP29032.1 hypothetical protein DL766_005559 [Monosporascus sp. MC13-8B]